MSGRGNHAETMTKAQAKSRRQAAEKFLDVGEMAASDSSSEWFRTVTVSLYVLAGIAAGDALCAAALGKRSRGQDHREAVRLLSTVEPDGAAHASSLRTLLDYKDGAHCSPSLIDQAAEKKALRAAQSLVEAAKRVTR